MRQFYIVFSNLKWNPVCSKFQKTLTYNDYSSTLSANSKHKNAINKGNFAITNSNRITLSADLIDKNISTYIPIIANLTWSHYTELISIKDINKMMYYLQISAEQRLDVRSLRSKIKSKEYERLDPETRTKLMFNNDLNIKDYVPNPILIKNNSGKEEISEKLLHALIMEDIGSFMKELGDGYCFIDSEYKLKINDRYNYIDLLLYNLRFRRYVVIELKVTELKSEYIGQILKYMHYVDSNIKTIEDDKTIGIIICKRNNQFYLEYCSDSRVISREYKLV